MTTTDRPPGRTARQLYKELDGPPDERFKKSLAGLARRLGERAKETPNDPQAAAAERRAALAAFDQARAHRVKRALVAGGAAGLAICMAGLIVLLATEPRLVGQPAKSATEAAGIAPAVEEAPRELASVAAAQGPELKTEPEKAPEPLQRDEMRELQARLQGFGFDAGPVDGMAGPMTRAAAQRYLQDRDLGQAVTTDRTLLEALRQDPAPQVARHAAAAPRAMRPPPPPRRAPDPFTAALWRMERWFQTGR